MKIIPKSSILQENLQLQLSREIKLHSSLHHPNICQLYGYSWDQSNIYLLLELCADGELFKILKHQLNEKETIYLIKQLTEAIKYMHGKNILHRDLKPENILLHEGTIKLVDFGWVI